jgi:hypothetical protein
MINGNMVGGTAPIKTVKIVDENGNEILGVVTESEVVFTATDNDVRTGAVYASDNGISTGVNDIPAYHTSEGKRLITAGSKFVIPLPKNKQYDYTALQVMICIYNTNISNSYAVDRVGIENNMFATESTEVIATITKDVDNQQINLGITNDTQNKFILRYFTYKEI